MRKVQFYKNENSLVLQWAGGSPKVLSKNDDATSEYSRCLAFIKENTDEADAKLYELLTGKAKKVKLYEEWNFSVEDDIVFVHGEPLPHSLGDRLTSYADEGLPCTSLLNFWAKLKENPSDRSKQQLFGFLDAGHFTFLENGNFIAYKRVQSDFKDFYTGRLDNSVGQVVKMDRSGVNEDPYQTCSYGLHVCAFDYLQYYRSGAGSVVVEVSVNPKDVVAVPTDYNNTKLRCCEYTVLAVNENGPRFDWVANEDGSTYVPPDSVDFDEDGEDSWDETEDSSDWDDDKDLCPDCGEDVCECETEDDFEINENLDNEPFDPSQHGYGYRLPEGEDKQESVNKAIDSHLNTVIDTTEVEPKKTGWLSRIFGGN